MSMRPGNVRPTPRPKRSFLGRLRHGDRGQGMTEYIIIVALIAIAAIGVVTIFGDNLRQIYGAVIDSLTGSTSNTPNTQKAGAAAQSKSLKNFGQHK